MEFVGSLIGNALLRNWKEDFEYLMKGERLVISLERDGVLWNRNNECVVYRDLYGVL